MDKKTLKKSKPLSGPIIEIPPSEGEITMFKKSICLMLVLSVFSFAPGRSARADDGGNKTEVAILAGAGILFIGGIIVLASLSSSEASPSSYQFKGPKDPSTPAVAGMLNQQLASAFKAPGQNKSPTNIASLSTKTAAPKVIPSIGFDPKTGSVGLEATGAF